MDDSSEDAAARKWGCNKGTKKVRFYTCPKTGIDFPLHDDDKKEDKDEEEEEEEEKEENEKD